MKMIRIVVLMLTVVLLALAACTNPTASTAVLPNTSTQQVVGQEFVKKILDSLQGSSGWTPPLPPTDGQKPRALTEEEKRRVVEIASAAPIVIQVKQNKDITSVDVSYLWVGWNGHPDGEGFLNYEPFENGTANISSTDNTDTWYPAADFLFHSIYGDSGKVGIQVAVNLETGKVVWLAGYASVTIPPKIPPPAATSSSPPSPSPSLIPPWSDAEVFYNENTTINVHIGDKFIIRYDFYQNMFPLFEETYDPTNIVTPLDQKGEQTSELQDANGVEWFLFQAIKAGTTNISIKEFTHQSTTVQSQKTFVVSVVQH